MSMANEDHGRTARHALWLTTTLNRNYSPEGVALHDEAAYRLHIALEALDDNPSARQVARLLAASRPVESDAQKTLTRWWLANLQDDTQTNSEQKLNELSCGTGQADVLACYAAQLGSLLTAPVEMRRALTHGLRQIELGTAFADVSRDSIETHARSIAKATPDVALFGLLQRAAEHELPELRQAARTELYRSRPENLVRWYDEARKLETRSPLMADLAAAYPANLMALSQTSPTEAWASLDDLEHRWRNGRPAIVSRSAVPVLAVFNAYAVADPLLASHACAKQIKDHSTTDARRAALTDMQENVIGLPPSAQLLLLAHLHARLIFEPDLVRPSREQLLELHQAYPDALAIETLRDLAIGDDVLQRRLDPKPTTPTAVQPPPPSQPKILGRLRRLFSPFGN